MAEPVSGTPDLMKALRESVDAAKARREAVVDPTPTDTDRSAPTFYECLRQRNVPVRYHEAALRAAHTWVASFAGLDETPLTLTRRLDGRLPGGKW